MENSEDMMWNLQNPEFFVHLFRKRSAEAQEKSQEALSEQVAAQLLTAKLNAYSSLVDHYSEEYRNITGNLTPADRAREHASRKIRTYLGQLETLVGKIRP